MAGFIEKTGQAHGVEESLWMTVAVSNGTSLHAVGYASDGEAPSLYHSRDTDDIFRINPDLRQLLTHSARVIVSEPVGKFPEMWEMIPQNSSVEVVGDKVEIRPFVPTHGLPA